MAQLRDLEVPAQPSWWPPAPGWWLLALLLAVLLLWLARRVHRRLAHRRPYRQARRELDRLQHAFERGTIDRRQFVDRANALVKRLCIHVRGEAGAARLSDAQWLRYLDGLAGEPLFSRGAGAALGAARYAPGFELDAPALIAVVRRLVGKLEADA